MARDPSFRLARLAGPFAIAVAWTFGTACGLVAHLVVANPGDWTAAALLDLFLAMGWIALVLNIGFALALVAAHAALERLWPEVLTGRRLRFVSVGIPALHVAWILLNRLPMLQHLVHAPVFVTPAGLVQASAIFVVTALLIAAGLLAGRRTPLAVAAVAIAGVLTTATLAWNAREEVGFRAYSMARVHAAAASSAPQETARPTLSDGPVIILALDGWGWDVVVPLLEAGRLPHTARLIQHGAVGYLDNANDSYSPRIWNTIFTGRDVADHDIQDFLAMGLPRSGRTLSNLVSQDPAIDSFYGMKQLLRRLPSLGLWEFVTIDSTKLGVKAIWHVASDYERRVVVANVLNTVPAQPVNGAMVSLQAEAIDPESFYPESLALRWTPHDTRTTGKRSLSAWDAALSREVDFALELFGENEVDLGIYYTKAIDLLAHIHWDFYAEGAWIATELPSDLSDAEWQTVVAQNAERAPFAAYGMIDRQLGRFLDAYPNATFVLMSDHAWTFSGYQHYGAQDGVFVVSGPRARAGAVIDGARIQDVTPTIATLLGLPLSSELPGRVVQTALVDVPTAREIASYGPAPEVATESTPLADETLSQLEELGYVQ